MKCWKYLDVEVTMRDISSVVIGSIHPVSLCDGDCNYGIKRVISSDFNDISGGHVDLDWGICTTLCPVQIY